MSMPISFSRRTFLGAAVASGSWQPKRQRPNILFIITDQQSQVAMGSSGNPHVRTPAMDSLAAEGISFSESYSTYPVCSPARSSFFTSRMPHETGVRVNGLAIAEGLPTMGELFREAGYQTVYAGKWHLPKPAGDVRGFERIAGRGGLGSEVGEPAATACVNFLAKPPKQPFLMVASFINPHDVCSWIRAHPGSRSYPELADFPPVQLNMAVDPEEPEYLQYHRTAGYNLMSEAVGIAAKWNRDDFRFYLRDYYLLVEEVDRQVGRLLAVLRAYGLYDNTLVVLTADHGEGLGSHRWVQKAAFWEEVVRVPLLIAGAGVGRRGVKDSRNLVSGLDILPTMCDYAGVRAPAVMRGRSLRGAIEGSSFDRPFVVSELSEYGEKNRQGRMLRTQRYKYVVFNGGRRPEQLFDLALDPGEVYNLAQQPGAASILREHRRRLAQWIRETRDDFPPPPPAVE
jgi:arylsulfatase A-like enzyme